MNTNGELESVCEAEIVLKFRNRTLSRMRVTIIMSDRIFQFLYITVELQVPSNTIIENLFSFQLFGSEKSTGTELTIRIGSATCSGPGALDVDCSGDVASHIRLANRTLSLVRGLDLQNISSVNITFNFQNKMNITIDSAFILI